MRQIVRAVEPAHEVLLSHVGAAIECGAEKHKHVADPSTATTATAATATAAAAAVATLVLGAAVLDAVSLRGHVARHESGNPENTEQGGAQLLLRVTDAKAREGEEHDCGNGKGVEEANRNDVRVLIGEDEQIIGFEISCRDQEPMPPAHSELIGLSIELHHPFDWPSPQQQRKRMER